MESLELVQESESQYNASSETAVTIVYEEIEIEWILPEGHDDTRTERAAGLQVGFRHWTIELDRYYSHIGAEG